MTTVTLEITLESPAVFSESAATTGNHGTLRYIPGRDLLGAAAARLYAGGQSESQVDDWIFAGLRFSDARPAHSGRPTVPMPLSFHRPKRDKNAVLYNSAVDRPAGQVTQERQGFLTDDHTRVEVTTQATMRTAIDEDGRARDGLLFQFTHLTAGQVFLATVSGPETAVRAAVAALTGPGVRLGRSRSAEFGAVRIREIGALPEFRSVRATQCVRVLLTSDLALLDPTTGAPRLTPEPQDFGLDPACHLDLKRSFLRTRAYSPWHGHRGRPDVERQVISAGSVLVFENVNDYGAIRAKQESGIGLFRGEGLGTFLIDPELLSQKSITPKSITAASPARVAPPTDALGQWLQRRIKQREAADTDFKNAQLELPKVSRWRVPKAQWGNVREIARRHRTSPKSQEFFNDLGKYTGATLGEGAPKPARALSEKWGPAAAELQSLAEEHGARFIEVLSALVRNHKEA